IRTVLIDDRKGRFAVFHTGFRNYFLRLGDYTETQFHRHADTIARIQDRLLTYCARWREHKGYYALQHYAEHLREAKRWNEIFAAGLGVGGYGQSRGGAGDVRAATGKRVIPSAPYRS